jgi:hypothetical protein
VLLDDGTHGGKPAAQRVVQLVRDPGPLGLELRAARHVPRDAADRDRLAPVVFEGKPLGEQQPFLSADVHDLFHHASTIF